MEKLKLILVDPPSSLCPAFQEYFNGLPNVEIVNGFWGLVSPWTDLGNCKLISKSLDYMKLCASS